MTEYRLGDLIDIKHGYAFDGEHITPIDNGIVLVTPGNFKIGGGFQEEKCKFFSGDIPQDYVLKQNDFIVTMTDLSKDIDTLGYSALIPKSPCRIYLHNQRIGLVTLKNDKCDKMYLYYLMQTHQYQRAIANTSSGATVHHTSPEKIKKFSFFAPDIITQKKISEILTAYDDLIENNQKQISLLEEAAQRLYKEWFVDLRFPGCEHTRIIDGLPEGWEYEKIGNRFKTYLGGTPSRERADFWQDGTIPWINSGTVNELRVIKPSEYITELALNNSATKLLPKHTTLVAITGATLGQISYTEIETCANQSVVGIVDESEMLSEYIYCFMSNNIKQIISKATGGAQQHINKDIVNNYKILIPDNDTVAALKRIIYPIFEKIRISLLQIEKLKEARDRLLPKLMNGEMEA